MIRPKALILVTSRPESVEVAVETSRPAVLALIFSQDVLLAVAAKCSELSDSGVSFRHRMVDRPMEIEDAFDKFSLALSDLEEMGFPPEEVLLDVTGGTTPMRVGTALAAMTRGIGMVHQRVPQRYVDGNWSRDMSRGIEVVPMQNPLLATGLLREGQAVELFNRRDYGAAALVFEDVAQKVSGVERRHYYRGLLLLSEGYAAWDVADYSTALDKLREAREELGVEFSEGDLAERAAGISSRIAAHMPFLGKVRKLSLESVVDMLENARRRIRDQRRHDDGVARLYRTVEMFHQWRLSQRSIDTANVDWSKVDEKSKELFLGQMGLDELPSQLDLLRARTLDRILHEESSEEEPVLRDLLRQRNHSILAHGLNPIGEKSARRFLDYVDGIFEEPEVRAGAEHLTLRGL
ncbi:MAG: TIGR02710 family CRISPR-associated CARF protein [Rubrobacteraceae bacterium]